MSDATHAADTVLASSPGIDDRARAVLAGLSPRVTHAPAADRQPRTPRVRAAAFSTVPRRGSGRRPANAVDLDAGSRPLATAGKVWSRQPHRMPVASAFAVAATTPRAGVPSRGFS